jgi:nitroreductase/Pyruvate/2-oxoacid:ferredoxin oxidoreductase delta subunit
MMRVDSENCIGCELCIKDCFRRDIELIDGKARINNVTCFNCGHCIAVCPKAAISTDEYNMNDVIDYSKDSFSIDAGNLLNFIKFRRTVRQFKNKEVETEKLLKIIEAGRFTETASNSQNVSYIVVREGLQELKGMAIESLKNIGEDMLSNLDPNAVQLKRYAEMWINMYEDFKENPKDKDRLFFNAPAVILIVSDSTVNAALASSNMELMTNALGLGTLFSGFFVRAAQNSKKIVDFLGLKEGKQIVTCMVIGYPDVKYMRTVPRKAADICWK